MSKIVILTGAGISAESGLSTFRRDNGLWNNYKIEDVATICPDCDISGMLKPNIVFMEMQQKHL